MASGIKRAILSSFIIILIIMSIVVFGFLLDPETFRITFKDIGKHYISMIPNLVFASFSLYFFVHRIVSTTHLGSVAERLSLSAVESKRKTGYHPVWGAIIAVSVVNLALVFVGAALAAGGFDIDNELFFVVSNIFVVIFLFQAGRWMYLNVRSYVFLSAVLVTLIHAGVNITSSILISPISPELKALLPKNENELLAFAGVVLISMVLLIFTPVLIGVLTAAMSHDRKLYKVYMLAKRLPRKTKRGLDDTLFSAVEGHVEAAGASGQ